MADLSKIKLNNTTYNLKDAQARTIFEVEGILEGDGEGNISAAGTTATSTLNIDSEPTPDSDHLVTSGGVWTAIQNSGGGGTDLPPQSGHSGDFLTTDGNDTLSWGTPTDTKNTAGSTDTSSKIYLIGATSQATNPQTYSDNEVYVTSGVLSANTFSGKEADLEELKMVTTLTAITSGRGDLGSSVSPRYLPYKWYASLGHNPVDREIIVIKTPSAGNTANVYLSINGDTDANYHPIAVGGTSRLTTQFASGTTLMLVYESTMTVTSYVLAGADSTSTITGIWRVLNYYDANTNTLLRTYKATNNIDLPITMYNSAASQTAANASISTYKDAYGAIANTNSPTINPSTGVLKAGSPEFSGTPTAPTATAGTNTTQIATTAFVQSAVSGITDNDNRDPGYGKITPAGDTGTSAVTANTTQIAAGTYNEAFTFKTGNKWLTVAGTSSSTNGSDILTIGHSAGLTAKTTYGSTATTASANGGTITVTDVKYDEAGHITGSTDRTITLSQTTYTVGNKALKIASNTGTATQAITVNENSSDRTLTIKGDGTYLSGSVSGSANAVTVAITPSDSGATAGSYGDSANQTPGYGSTFKVPYITVDAKGRITEISEHTVKIPASDNTNTDTLVKQTSKTDNIEYKILTTISASPTSGSAAEAAYDTGITINPSTHTITATNFAGNASSATKLGSTTVGSSTQPIYLSNGTATTCSTYAGGTAVTLNGTSKAASTASFYAPTGAGTSGQILSSNGSGAPSWINMPDASAFKAYKATNNIELPVLLINGSASQTTTNPSISTSVSAYGAIPNSNAPTVNSSTGALTVNSTTNLKEKIILRKSYNYDTVMPTETSATTGQLFFTSEGVGGGVSSISQTLDKIYMVGIKSESDDTLYYNENVYAQNNVLYGAAWNDYAEYRESFEIEPGRVIIELGNGRLIRSTDRLQPGAEIISDTYGFIIGKGNPRCSTPVAVCGRVLAYTYEDRHLFGAGDAVCSGPDGTVSKMTREEIKEYPERIIGIVSEVPEYETWGTGNIKVNNRIWIRLR